MTVIDRINAAALSYRAFKAEIGSWTGASEDLLHLHAGLLIFVLAALLLRKKMRSRIPLACVIVFAVLNEVVDWMSGEPIASIEPIVDIANTVFWPAVLFALARRWR